MSCDGRRSVVAARDGEQTPDSWIALRSWCWQSRQMSGRWVKRRLLAGGQCAGVLAGRQLDGQFNSQTRSRPRRRKGAIGSVILLSRTALDWSRTAVNRFYYVRLICSAFLTQDRINSKRSDIAPMKTCDCFYPPVPRPRYFWRDSGELCRKVCKCSDFGHTVICSTVCNFAEVLADNSRWYLASVIVLFTIVFGCMTDCNLTFNTVRCPCNGLVRELSP